MQKKTSASKTIKSTKITKDSKAKKVLSVSKSTKSINATKAAKTTDALKIAKVNKVTKVNKAAKKSTVKSSTPKTAVNKNIKETTPPKVTSITPANETSLANEKSFDNLSQSSIGSGDYTPKSGALQINHISKVYNKKTVVNNVSFEVNQGEVVGLLGPNGAGKTTSFYVAVGLIRPEQGKVFFDMHDITAYPMHKRANLGIGYLPQEASVFRKLSVHDNVMCILEARGYPRNKRATRVKEILEQLHVSHVAKQYGFTLSGGERRRVEIARSLACDPKIILLDEPFAGVDPIAVKDIQTVIQQIQEMDIGILITDHNVRETLKIVSRAYIMSEGKVILQGTAKQLVSSKKAREIYLGDDFQL